MCLDATFPVAANAGPRFRKQQPSRRTIHDTPKRLYCQDEFTADLSPVQLVMVTLNFSVDILSLLMYN